MQKLTLLSIMSGMSFAAMAAGTPDLHFNDVITDAVMAYDRVAQVSGKHVRVFNAADRQGFVLTYGDKVVGYSDDGAFSLQTAAPALIDMLDAMDGEIGTDYALFTPVAPLCSARGPIMWNQDTPFNDLCPMYDITNHCPSGCVATAMAQVMYYHQWPPTGVGSHTYSPAVLAGNTLSADFGNTTYCWDAMLPEYFSGRTAEGYTEVQSREAVAQLMLHCGVAVDMVYYTQSGATDYDVPPALVNYFRYDPGMAYRKREHYSTVDWLNVINAELQAGRMVLAYGRASSGGHAFVFDGMDEHGFIHVNWGWGGMSNGYFATSALTPASQGIGGSDGGFNYSQRIITGIKPAVEGVVNDSHVELTSTEGLSVAKNKVPMGSEVTIRLSGKVTNQGWQRSTFDYALIMLKNDSDTVCIVPGPKVVTLNKDESGYAPNFGNVKFPDLTEGTYMLYPACRASDGTGPWQRIRDSYIGYPNYLQVTAYGSNLTFSQPDYFYLRAISTEAPEVIYSGVPTLITTTIVNEGDVAYHGEIKAVLRSGNTNVATTTNYIIDLAPAERTDIRFTDALKAAPGDYTLVLIDDDGRALSSPIAVKVVDAPKQGTVTSAADIVIESNAAYDMAVKATVRVDGGDFNGMLYAYIYSADGHKQQGCLFPEYLSMTDSTEAEVTLSGTFENGIPGTTYLIRLVTYDGTSFRLLEDELSYMPFTFMDSGSVTSIENENAEYIYYDVLGRIVDPKHTKTYKKLRIRK